MPQNLFDIDKTSMTALLKKGDVEGGKKSHLPLSYFGGGSPYNVPLIIPKKRGQGCDSGQ